MATLVDLRSEPAVEELSRQIMSEAKLWEAIQEARLELLRQQRTNKAVSSIIQKLIKCTMNVQIVFPIHQLRN